MESELEEGEIDENEEVNCSNEFAASPPSPFLKATKHGRRSRESRRNSFHRENGPRCRSRPRRSRHDSNRKRKQSLSPVRHSRRHSKHGHPEEDKWRAVDKHRSPSGDIPVSSSSKSRNYLRRHSHSTSARHDITNDTHSSSKIHSIGTGKTETLRVRNSGNSADRSSHPSKKRKRQKVETIVKLSEVDGMPVVTRREIRRETTPKIPSVERAPKMRSISTESVLILSPELKPQVSPELIELNSSDDEKVSCDGKESEDASTDCGAEELELRRVALEGLFNNLQRQEAQKDETADEELDELRNRLLLDLAQRNKIGGTTGSGTESGDLSRSSSTPVATVMLEKPFAPDMTVEVTTTCLNESIHVSRRVTISQTLTRSETVDSVSTKRRLSSTAQCTNSEMREVLNDQISTSSENSLHHVALSEEHLDVTRTCKYKSVGPSVGVAVSRDAMRIHQSAAVPEIHFPSQTMRSLTKSPQPPVVEAEVTTDPKLRYSSTRHSTKSASTVHGLRTSSRLESDWKVQAKLNRFAGDTRESESRDRPLPFSEPTVTFLRESVLGTPPKNMTLSELSLECPRRTVRVVPANMPLHQTSSRLSHFVPTGPPGTLPGRTLLPAPVTMSPPAPIESDFEVTPKFRRTLDFHSPIRPPLADLADKTPKSVQSQSSYSSPRDFNKTPDHESPSCSSRQLAIEPARSPLQTSYEDSEITREYVNALHETIVSNLPIRKRSATPDTWATLECKREGVSESVPCISNSNLLEVKAESSSFPSPALLPDLRNNLNARHNSQAERSAFRARPGEVGIEALALRGRHLSASATSGSENTSKCAALADTALRKDGQEMGKYVLKIRRKPSQDTPAAGGIKRKAAENSDNVIMPIKTKAKMERFSNDSERVNAGSQNASPLEQPPAAKSSPSLYDQNESKAVLSDAVKLSPLPLSSSSKSLTPAAQPPSNLLKDSLATAKSTLPGSDKNRTPEQCNTAHAPRQSPLPVTERVPMASVILATTPATVPSSSVISSLSPKEIGPPPPQPSIATPSSEITDKNWPLTNDAKSTLPSRLSSLKGVPKSAQENKSLPVSPVTHMSSARAPVLKEKASSPNPPAVNKQPSTLSIATSADRAQRTLHSSNGTQQASVPTPLRLAGAATAGLGSSSFPTSSTSKLSKLSGANDALSTPPVLKSVPMTELETTKSALPTESAVVGSHCLPVRTTPTKDVGSKGLTFDHGLLLKGSPRDANQLASATPVVSVLNSTATPSGVVGSAPSPPAGKEIVLGGSGSRPTTPVVLAANTSAYLESLQRCKTKQFPKKAAQNSQPMNFQRSMLTKPINKIVIPLGDDSSSEEEEERAKSSVTHSDTNPAPLALPPNFDIALNAMLKSARETVEAKEGKRFSQMTSDEIIQASLKELLGQSRGLGSSGLENLPGQSREKSTKNSISEGLSERTREALASGISTPSTSLSAETEIVRKREELELREKLLKATLLKKMNKSQLKLQLAATENKLISTRSNATEMFVKLHSSMANYKEKRIYFRQLYREVERLRTELEAAVKRMQITKKSATLLAGEVRQSSKVSFAIRNKCIELTKSCLEIGEQVSGPLYKLPLQGENQLKEMVKQVRKQSSSMKKFNEKNKPLENVVILASGPLPPAAHPPPPSQGASVASRCSASAGGSEQLPGSPQSSGVDIPPYRIDVEPTKEEEEKASPILTDVHFTDVLMTPGEELDELIPQAVSLSDEFSAYALLSPDLSVTPESPDKVKTKPP